jgi:hypothetical protein
MKGMPFRTGRPKLNMGSACFSVLSGVMRKVRYYEHQTQLCTLSLASATGAEEFWASDAQRRELVP